MASSPKWRSGEGSLGDSGQAACGGRVSKLGSVASLLALGRVGFQPRRSGPGDAGTWAFWHRGRDVLSLCVSLPVPEVRPGSRLPGQTPCHRPSAGHPTWEAGRGSRIRPFFVGAATCAQVYSGSCRAVHLAQAHRAGHVPKAARCLAARPLLAAPGQDRWGLGPQPRRGWQPAASGAPEDDHLSFN